MYLTNGIENSKIDLISLIAKRVKCRTLTKLILTKDLSDKLHNFILSCSILRTKGIQFRIVIFVENSPWSDAKQTARLFTRYTKSCNKYNGTQILMLPLSPIIRISKAHFTFVE